MTIQVSNAVDLQQALSSAADGSVIELAGGDYGSLLLKNLDFASGVQIRSANPGDPATFSSISTTNVHGLHFDSLAVKFEPTATTQFHEQAIRINLSSDISFTNSTVTGGPSVNGVDPSADKLDSTGNVLGLPVGRAIMVTNSTGIDISDNEISQFHKGIVLSKVSGATITGNEIHDLRTTPLGGGGVSDILVDGNYFHDSNPWNFGGKGDHGDMMHFWTVPGYDTEAAKNITITNNRMDQGDGHPMLGIYLDDNNNGIGFVGVMIDNNVIANDNNQAIRLENVSGSVTRNTMTTEGSTAPGILLRDGSLIELIDNLGILRTDESSKTSGQAELHGPGADLSKVGLPNRDGSAEPPAGENPPSNPAPGDETPDKPGHDADGGDEAPAAPPPSPPNSQLVEKTANAGATSVHDRDEASLLVGSADDNSFKVTHENTRISEDADGGIDSVHSFVSYKLDANVENLTLKGEAQYGIGNELDNQVKGNELDNLLDGHDGNDTLMGYGGDDVIDGGAGNDRLFGGDGNDRIEGGDGDDTLFGDAGNDLLSGGAGSDKIYGGAGADVMFGGAGADLFVFMTEDFAGAPGPDVIGDFSSAEGDRVALNPIDAIAGTGPNDKFSFVGTADFSGKAGELRYSVNDGSAHVAGDWDGDGVADFSIILEGVTSLNSSDFIL